MALIQETIERSFFEAIRLILVSDGWTPDISDTGLFPNTPTGYEAYLTALELIRTNKSFAIEAFGTSNPQSKGVKNLPRITLQTSAFLPGDVGIDSTPFPVLNPETNKFDLYSYDSRTYDLFVDCKVSASTQEQLRILMDSVHRALPLMGYLKYYNNPAETPDESFMVQFGSFQPYIDPKDGVLEYNYRYEVPDIVWRELVEVESPIPGGIPKISEITLNLMVEQRLGISKTIT